MRTALLNVLGICAFALSLIGCQKQTEEYKIEALAEYMPLQPGKYIIYRVDSTVFTNFGRVEEIHSYQEKQIIDSAFTDNLGRPGFRIFRFQRDTAGLQPWRSTGTYFITPLTNTIEVVDNNQRVIKLALPVKQDNTWKGNRYLPNDPYGYKYNFSNDENMADWDFTMDDIDGTETLNGKTYTNIVTVFQADESLNAPVSDPNAYGSRTYSIDKYSKGIGLIYNELLLWEYQPLPNSSIPNDGYKVGFGVKRSIIDHN